ncbi:hypothetical protein BH09ACT8_BH09ACT8_52350 [soil metagenome]
MCRGSKRSLGDQTAGAWLWARRQGVISGVAASALHGAPWVDADTPIELNWGNGRPPPGVVVRHDVLRADEVTKINGLPVTSLARTAYDVARYLPRTEALQRLDALMWATSFSREDVALIAKRNQGARGLRQLRELLPLVDGGAASPQETWLRLLLIDEGFPIPQTQIPVRDDQTIIGWLDMGWEDVLVGVEYDGAHHQKVRRHYVKDRKRSRAIDDLRWNVVSVIAEDRRPDIVARVRTARLQSRR